MGNASDLRDPSIADRVLAVVPVLDWETHGHACLDSIVAPDSSFGLSPESVLVVDNSRIPATVSPGMVVPDDVARGGVTGSIGGEAAEPFRVYRDADGHNLGVARAWNVGARAVLDEGQDYLVVCSSVMRFGPLLHTSWLAQMERVWGARVIECDGHSWHLIAFHRTVLETVGLFDENFYPAYIEGIDYGYRLRQLGWEGGWPRMWINAMSAGVAAHVEMLSCPWAPLNDYYVAKWGGEKGQERYDRPFDHYPLDFWPKATIPELAERYKLETWW